MINAILELHFTFKDVALQNIRIQITDIKIIKEL